MAAIRKCYHYVQEDDKRKHNLTISTVKSGAFIGLRGVVCKRCNKSLTLEELASISPSKTLLEFIEECRGN